ncbi:hypothetical protein GGI23_006417, partial [Coemansia sp. RSA 2559]
LCRAEHIWTLLLLLHIGDELLDVLNEVGQDDLDWPTAKQMIEKRMFRPIHRFRLVEAALNGYQGSAATPYKKARRDLSLVKELCKLSLEEILFFLVYYKMGPEETRK